MMMGDIFIVYFLVGSWCALVHLNPWFVVAIAAVLLVFMGNAASRAALQRAIVSGLLGCVWGFVHNQSISPRAMLSAIDASWVEVAAYLPRQKLLQVRNELGQKIVVYRTDNVTSVPEVSCRRAMLGLQPFRCKITELDAGHLAAHLRETFMLRLRSALPQRIASWYGGLFLGEQSGFDQNTMRSFRVFGLFHIISVSGFHFSLLFLAISALLNIPLRCLFSLALFSNRGFKIGQLLIAVVAAALMIAFAWLLEFPQPCQRALFSCLAQLVNRQRDALHLDPLRCAALGQMVFFPVGFWEASNLLSWGAYLIVSRTGSGEPSLKQIIAEQFVLALPATILVREVTIFGLVFNVLFGALLSPIFFVALVHGGLLMLRSAAFVFFEMVLQGATETFLWQVEWYAKIAAKLVPFSWLILRPRQYLLSIQLGALVLFAGAVLYRSRKKC